MAKIQGWKKVNENRWKFFMGVSRGLSDTRIVGHATITQLPVGWGYRVVIIQRFTGQRGREGGEPEIIYDQEGITKTKDKAKKKVVSLMKKASNVGYKEAKYAAGKRGGKLELRDKNREV